MSFSLDEMPDPSMELPVSVRLMRETIQIITKFLPQGLPMIGTDDGLEMAFETFALESRKLR